MYSSRIVCNSCLCLAETCRAQIISLILLEHILLVLSFFGGIFNVIRETLITCHLQTTVRKKLRKTWVSKAPIHVFD